MKLDMAEKPTIPTVSLEVWRDLYAAADKFRKQAPWEWMHDSDVFGVQSNATGETLYGCVMGAGGQTFGLALYRGAEGLDMYLGIQSGDIDPTDEALHMRQNSLLVELTEKRFMEPFDLEVVQKLGLKPRGKGSWTLLRSLLPDHAPWAINESEARALIDALEVCEIHANKLEDDPEYDFAHGDDKIAIYKKAGKTWKPAWRTIKTLMSERASSALVMPEPLNELLLQKIQRRELRTGSVWEAAVFYLPSLIFDAERPYYAKACALVEEKTGFCIGVEIIRPEHDPISKLRNLALEKMDHFGYKPKALRIDSPDLLVGLATVKEAVGVEIEIDDLGSMPELVEALYRDSLKHEERIR